MSNFVSRGV